MTDRRWCVCVCVCVCVGGGGGGVEHKVHVRILNPRWNFIEVSPVQTSCGRHCYLYIFITNLSPKYKT